jgi:hypothetical protein
VHTARQSNRLPRRLRHALPHDPTPGKALGIVAGVASAVLVVVVAIAAIAAAVIGPGNPAPSIAGTWNDGGTSFTFTSSGPDSYTVSVVTKAAPQCAQADDGTVTGSNRHYQGSINLYRQSGATSGACQPKVGVAQVAIAVAANGTTASVNLVGSNCSSCGAATWTRQS